MLTRAQKLGLYKRMIRHATVFPSVRRGSILAHIRHDWRKHVDLEDDAKIEEELKVADAALEQLMEFSKINTSPGHSFSIDVGGMKFARKQQQKMIQEAWNSDPYSSS